MHFHLPATTIRLQIALILLLVCSPTTTSPSTSTIVPHLKAGGYVVATLRTFVRRPRSSPLGQPVVNWRLFNECSGGFVQSFLRTVNALGRNEDVCLTYFAVWMRHSDGTVALQNARSKRFLCLNNRKRLTSRTNGNSQRCRFVEHLNGGGYTLLESAHESGVFLGFGLHGHPISVGNQSRKRRCLQFTKLESELSNDSLKQADCSTASRRAHSKPNESSIRSLTAPDLSTNFIHRALVDRVLL